MPFTSLTNKLGYTNPAAPKWPGDYPN